MDRNDNNDDANPGLVSSRRYGSSAIAVSLKLILNARGQYEMLIKKDAFFLKLIFHLPETFQIKSQYKENVLAFMRHIWSWFSGCHIEWRRLIPEIPGLRSE